MISLYFNLFLVITHKWNYYTRVHSRFVKRGFESREYSLVVIFQFSTAGQAAGFLRLYPIVFSLHSFIVDVYLKITIRMSHF